MILASVSAEIVPIAVSALAAVFGAAGVLNTFLQLRRDRKKAEEEVEIYRNVGLAKGSKAGRGVTVDKDGNMVISVEGRGRFIVTVERDANGQPEVKIRPEVVA